MGMVLTLWAAGQLVIMLCTHWQQSMSCHLQTTTSPAADRPVLWAAGVRRSEAQHSACTKPRLYCSPTLPHMASIC